MSSFAVLDADRAEANRSLRRMVFDSFGVIEPYVEEVDGWFSMPLRLVHDQAAGWHLELGPYSLDGADVERLRAAIHAYDQATGNA